MATGEYYLVMGTTTYPNGQTEVGTFGADAESDSEPDAGINEAKGHSASNRKYYLV